MGRQPSDRGPSSPSLLLASSGRKLLAEALAGVLRETGGFVLVADPVHERGEILRVCSRRRPDLFVFDIDGAPPSDIVGLVMDVKRRSSRTKVFLIVGSRSDEDMVLLDYVDAGAEGFLDRSEDLLELQAALRAGAEDELVVPNQHLVSLLRTAARERGTMLRGTELLRSLTSRELQILRLMVEGLSNELIARELHISVRTVASHVQNLFRKMNVHSRLEAAALANRTGLTRFAETG
jgi:two-component system, NarL family, nitrate/nitrite response regulator NarL